MCGIQGSGLRRKVFSSLFYFRAPTDILPATEYVNRLLDYGRESYSAYATPNLCGAIRYHATQQLMRFNNL